MYYYRDIVLWVLPLCNLCSVLPFCDSLRTVQIDGALEGSSEHARVWAHVTHRPHLLAFYERMKAHVFPSGAPKDQWQAQFQS